MPFRAQQDTRNSPKTNLQIYNIVSVDQLSVGFKKMLFVQRSYNQKCLFAMERELGWSHFENEENNNGENAKIQHF